jgi:hypothetical protein
MVHVGLDLRKWMSQIAVNEHQLPNDNAAHEQFFEALPPAQLLNGCPAAG